METEKTGKGSKLNVSLIVLSNKLECLSVEDFRDQGAYSQHFIFFITCHWTKLARVLHYTRLERLAWDKHSSLLGPLVSYEENEAL